MTPSPTDTTAIEALVRAAQAVVDTLEVLQIDSATVAANFDRRECEMLVESVDMVRTALAAYAQRPEIGRRPKILAKVEAELCRASACSKCHDTGAVEAECSMPGNTRKCDQCDPYALWREIKYLRARAKLLGDALDEDCQRATVAAFAEHAYAQRPPASEPAPAATDDEFDAAISEVVKARDRRHRQIGSNALTNEDEERCANAHESLRTLHTARVQQARREGREGRCGRCASALLVRRRSFRCSTTCWPASPREGSDHGGLALLFVLCSAAIAVIAITWVGRLVLA